MTDASRDAIAAIAETAASAIAACATLDLKGRARTLGEAGLIGVLAAEEAGGLALGLDHAVPVARASGLLAFPLLDSMLLAAALGDAPEAAALIQGEAIGTIAWAGRARLSGGTLTGIIGRAPMAEGADLLLVATDEGGAVVRTADPGVTIRPADSLDLEVPEHEVALAGAAPVAILGAAAMAEIEARAQVLRAAAIGGMVETCLAMAVEHTGTREQFGRKLVHFQSLRHALARQKLAAEHIGAAIERSLMRPDDTLAAAAAFTTATRFGISAVESALQLHGGMGFTWDIPVHRHLRRIRTLEAQGDSAGLHRRLAQRLLDANA